MVFRINLTARGENVIRCAFYRMFLFILLARMKGIRDEQDYMFDAGFDPLCFCPEVRTSRQCG